MHQGTTGSRPHVRRRRATVFSIAGVVVLAVVLGLVWAFALGPLSSRARDERAIGDAVHRLHGAGSFSEFNEQLCARDRVPQFLIDGISHADPANGSDLEAQFRDKALPQMPADVEVRDVDVHGDSADAHVDYDRDGSTVTEELHFEREDGTWRVCKDGLGMSGMPGAPR